jgi:Sulfotransferase family
MKHSHVVQLILDHYGLDPDAITQRLRFSTFVSLPRRYMYFEVPKAACSTVKELLRRLEGAQPMELLSGDVWESRRDMFVHWRNNIPLPSLPDLDDNTQREVLESPTFFRLTFVRNPYTRLASAWRNKVMLCEPGKQYVASASKVYSEALADRVYSLYEKDFEAFDCDRDTWPSNTQDSDHKEPTVSQEKFNDEAIERNLVISLLYEERERLQEQLNRVSQLHLNTIAEVLHATEEFFAEMASSMKGKVQRLWRRWFVTGRYNNKPGGAAVWWTHRDERPFLLNKMPRGPVCAEIGVWKREFLKRILGSVRPRVLRLIDPWKFEAEEIYKNSWYGGRSGRDHADMDSVYQSVQHRFEKKLRRAA